MSVRYFAGLDLGQAQDYTALTIVDQQIIKVDDPTPVREFGGYVGGLPQYHHIGVEQEYTREYHLRYLVRFKLGTRYPDIAKEVATLLSTPPLCGNVAQVADATGVGRPVIDMLREYELRPVPVTITGGDRANYEATTATWTVPKRELVSVLQVFFQTDRLAFADGLPDLPVLIEELQQFKAKIDISTGHDTYEAWRERDHDDMVLSLALAVWYAEKLLAYFGPSDGPSGWGDLDGEPL